MRRRIAPFLLAVLTLLPGVPATASAAGVAGPAAANTAANTAASPATQETAPDGLSAAGRYIVVLKSGADTGAVVDRHHARDGLTATRTFKRAFRGFTAKLDGPQRAALAADPTVAEIVPDELVQLTAQTIPTGVARIGTLASPLALINGVDDVRVDADVAIVDTGVAQHPDLNVVGGYNCSTSDPTAWGDDNGHGTHVAGTVAALDNDFGVVGVAPGARIWSVRILNADGYGLLSWYVCGLDWILAQRDPNDSSRPLFEAVNMSVAKDGADDVDCGYTNADILHQAICRVVAGGITVVAAAGNDHHSASSRVPAAYNEVITVSALADTDGKPGGVGGNRCNSWGGYDQDDTFADFSNYGSDIDLIAPGKCIWSTKPNNTYAYSSGTSMAAPAVTGAVALYKSTRPNATPAEVKEALQYLGNLGWKTSTDPDPYHEKLLDVSRLGPLGTFSVAAGTAPVVGEGGGTVTVPITLTRSATFFERVSMAVGSLPSGWTATVTYPSLIGWTANQDTVRVSVPHSTPAGTYQLTVTAANQGRVDSATATVTIVNDLPTARAVSIAPLGGSSATTTTIPVALTWAAATDPTSGIAGYEIQVRTDGGAWGPSVALGAATRRFVQWVAPAHLVEARIRAQDTATNWSPWVTSAPFTAGIVDDRSGSIHYSSGWTASTSGGAIAGTFRRTNRTGATATLTFRGRGLAIAVPIGPRRGRIAIRVDGKLVKTVSLSASVVRQGRLVYAVMLPTGTHKVVITSLGGGVVPLDAIIVIR